MAWFAVEPILSFHGIGNNTSIASVTIQHESLPFVPGSSCEDPMPRTLHRRGPIGDVPIPRRRLTRGCAACILRKLYSDWSGSPYTCQIETPMKFMLIALTLALLSPAALTKDKQPDSSFQDATLVSIRAVTSGSSCSHTASTTGNVEASTDENGQRENKHVSAEATYPPCGSPRIHCFQFGHRFLPRRSRR